MINIEDKIISEAVKQLLPEVYNDLAKPSIQVTGETLQRTTKALLSPLRGLLWGWEKIEVWIYDTINHKFDNIPEKNRKSPAPEIAVPLIEAMRYTANNETLREMYAKLLANSMDNRQDKNVHPSYVEIIKQMNSLDAILFKSLKDSTGYIKAINPHIGGGDILKGKYYTDSLPDWYIGVQIPEYDMFDISTGILRLGRLGLIDLMFDRIAGGENYDELVKNKEIQERLSLYKRNMNDLSLEIKKTDSVINVNDFGKMFAKVCL